MVSALRFRAGKVCTKSRRACSSRSTICRDASNTPATVPPTSPIRIYKAVSDQRTTSRGADYTPGSTPEVTDWADHAECGQGLHFGPTPAHALAYLPDATRFVAVGVELATLRPIPGGTAKCKAPKVVRACVEVDLDGNEVES